MTTQQIKEIIHKYRTVINSAGLTAQEFPLNQYAINSNDQLKHCLYMIDKLEDFITDNSKQEKAFRWLGFIQGVLWAHCMYTIEELKGDNSVRDTGTNRFDRIREINV